MLAALLLLAAEPAVWIYGGPRPEVTRAYKDWVTGCDNEHNCSAIALEASEIDKMEHVDHLEILIEQASAHHLDPVVSIRFRGTEAELATESLFVDDTRTALPPLSDGRFRFTGAAARSLVQKMRAGKWAILRPSGDEVAARASLSGLTAALLRIDEQQDKAGTPRGLARSGTRRPYDDLTGYSVTLGRNPGSDRPPAVGDATSPDVYANDQCGAGDSGSSPLVRAVRLDSDSSMLIAPWRCGNGAFNIYANILIVNDAGVTRAAEFDYDNGITGDGPSNVLVNVSWNDEQRVLESFLRTRGIGDQGRCR